MSAEETMKKIERHGILGWVATAIVVVAYDYWAIHGSHQTMSSAFKNGLSRKTTVMPTFVSWVILTWHLFRPESLRKTDLFSFIVDRKGID